MNLYAKLQERKENPLRLGLIGAGKFAAMYLAQVPRTPGIHLVGIADLAPGNAKANLERVGWKRPQVAAALRAIDARDGVGLLRPDARAGEARRSQSEDVQLVPRRLEAGNRNDGGVQCHGTHAGARWAALPAGLGG